MSDEELRVTRRRFLRHSAVAAAAAGGLPSIALKTDALAEAPPQGVRPFGTDDSFPYPYADP
jgi:hypothetical protein